jgi:iron complex transport system ATP-binding protein
MDSEKNIVETKNLCIGFPGRKKQEKLIFGNINLQVSEGELVALLGANGAGKSTLLRSLVKLQSPLSGEIFLFGRETGSFSRGRLARKVGFVSTEIIQVNNLSVYDLVALGRYPHTGWTGRLTGIDGKKVDEAIEMVGLGNFRHRNINRLSDGERQRAMIARTLAQDTDLIILDEPTAFLDLPNRYEIVHLLHRLAKERKKTIIFSTHDLAIAIQEADRLWLMLNEVVVQGAPEDLILAGSFGRLFENSNLKFNPSMGEFRIERGFSGKVSLQGPETEVYWTKNALERIGFREVAGEKAELEIIVGGDREIRKWTLIIGSGQLSFLSIHELCTYLEKSLPLRTNSRAPG